MDRSQNQIDMNSLDREWERFTGGPTPTVRDRIHVTMNANGKIYLNANTHRLLGRPTGVYLYFNRRKDAIALEPTGPRMPEAFPVCRSSTGFVVHANPFCRHHGIKYDKTTWFARADINEKGILILNLSSAVTIGTITRGRKRK